MNCLECVTLMAASYEAPAAVACCVYCGAGICLDHVRLVVLSARPVGVVPAHKGSRRIMCATCYVASGIREVASLTFPVEYGGGPGRRKLAAFMSVVTGWAAQRRR